MLQGWSDRFDLGYLIIDGKGAVNNMGGTEFLDKRFMRLSRCCDDGCKSRKMEETNG
jgi:hypothetical protein